MAPVKVFGPAMSKNVPRVLVCLEEVGAEYEVVDIDFKAMGHKSPGHLFRNIFFFQQCVLDDDYEHVMYILDCCEPLHKVKAEGIIFGKVVCLAHYVGARVQSFRADQTTIHDFGAHLMRCAASQDCHLISSYHRSPFKQVPHRQYRKIPQG
ncbi:hypothetical protein ZWY2020_042026 [Hordeum vulgare]|nr:hypothetical protein ZWY2020_042026 [Hordeum vulgare]